MNGKQRLYDNFQYIEIKKVLKALCLNKPNQRNFKPKRVLYFKIYRDIEETQYNLFSIPCPKCHTYVSSKYGNHKIITTGNKKLDMCHICLNPREKKYKVYTGGKE